ncbi:MAG: MFS transporter [Anaerolineaceae bacterium]|nr:MFS transporter [Anaerolineaceae bacterium]
MVREFLKGKWGFDRNINLYLLMLTMINIGFGIIEADFNLYILSMGISPDILGVILSLTPFAMVLTAIPIGFIAEKIGSKWSFILVNMVVGLAHLMRVTSPNQTQILIGSFLIGVVQPGYFIVQMPFINHYAGKQKDQEYAFASIALYASRALGNLLGGFLPILLGSTLINETSIYRTVMVGASMLAIVGTIPIFFLKKDKPAETGKISLSPYLHGIDKNTIRFASVEFFLGIGLGFLMFFMNVIFVFYFKSTLQAYGTMSALMIIPIIAFILVGPAIAKKYGGLRIVVISRILCTAFALMVIITVNPLVGAAAYILFRSVLGLGTSLWLSFVSTVATRRSRTATSTWLEITFQIGFGVAALAGGRLVGLDAYPVLGIISAVSMAISYGLTVMFFGKKYLSGQVLN